jgi:hypothetical protein
MPITGGHGKAKKNMRSAQEVHIGSELTLDRVYVSETGLEAVVRNRKT